eukprot:1047369-Amphidinium_carterae.1
MQWCCVLNNIAPGLSVFRALQALDDDYDLAGMLDASGSSRNSVVAFEAPVVHTPEISPASLVSQGTVRRRGLDVASNSRKLQLYRLRR